MKRPENVKAGDKFISSNHFESVFDAGTIVELIYDDHSICPKFKGIKNAREIEHYEDFKCLDPINSITENIEIY